MTRIRLPLGRWVFLGVATLVLLVAFLPLRLALGWFGAGPAGLTAREARGSVWSGRLTEARFGGIAIGDVAAGLAPLRLLVGEARVGLSRDDGEGLAGAVVASPRAIGIAGVTGAIPVGTLLAPLPVTALALEDVTVRFNDGQCREANGRVRAQLSGAIPGLALADGLQGALRCDGGAMLLPLAGASGAERVDLRLAQSGAWTADVAIATGDATLGAGLVAAGFSAGQGGYRLQLTGPR